MASSRKKTIWNFADKFEGDKVVWMIVLLLILLSIVCIFSSTSRLLGEGETRLDIVGNQLLFVLISLGIIIGLYNIRSLKFFRFCSKWGFLFSFLILLFLDLHLRLPFMEAKRINGAWRIISIAGFQVHVFEMVKVAMVLYMSWAIEKLKKGPFPLLDSFKDHPKLKFLSTRTAKKCIYLYIPFLIVMAMVLPGSNSSALFISGILFLVIVIGGGEIRDMALLACAGIVVVSLCTGIYFISGKKAFSRIGTGIERVFSDEADNEKIVLESPQGSKAFYDALDEILQPYSAKIAVKQGGLFGKGAGQSRQRYIVPDISEDYMFSFIIEEYGLLGGLFVLMLYLSLMARGVIITRNCGDELFAKCAIAGLCLLITGQAFLHMFVNVDIGPMTGQTLPLISHGNSALICFSVAFGVILAISRISSRRVKMEEKAAAPIMDLQGLQDLDAFDSGRGPATDTDTNELISDEYDL